MEIPQAFVVAIIGGKRTIVSEKGRKMTKKNQHRVGRSFFCWMPSPAHSMEFVLLQLADRTLSIYTRGYMRSSQSLGGQMWAVGYGLTQCRIPESYIVKR